MKKIRLLLAAVVLALCLTGCGKDTLAGEGKCRVALENVPKELEMLDENLLEQFRIVVSLENIYLEKSVKVELTAENDFSEELKLLPGTYVLEYCYATPDSLVPLAVEADLEKMELTKDNPMQINVMITNREEFADWAWDNAVSREVLAEGAFSHRIQFEGQLIDVTKIADYVEFSSDNQVRGYEKATLTNTEKGVTIVVLNENEAAADWQDCRLIKVTFDKNNIIWGQGAFVGMEIKEAVHVKEGLYGEPYEMSGTVLAGLDYASTYVSYLDAKSGDKLTLKLRPDGEYISEISYELEVFE